MASPFTLCQPLPQQAAGRTQPLACISCLLCQDKHKPGIQGRSVLLTFLCICAQVKRERVHTPAGTSPLPSCVLMICSQQQYLSTERSPSMHMDNAKPFIKAGQLHHPQEQFLVGSRVLAELWLSTAPACSHTTLSVSSRGTQHCFSSTQTSAPVHGDTRSAEGKSKS